MTEKAISIIQKEFGKIRNSKVPDHELKKAKESIKGNLILSLENTSNRMIRMAQSELYYNKIKTMEEVIKKIDAVTSKDILETANELLDENSLVQIIIKSKNGLQVRQKRTAA
jgi:predicted Zn-dependent peptidase